MSKEELSYYRMKLYEETTDMKARFDRLVFHLQQTVEKSYQVKDIARLLKSHEKLFEKPLCECATVSDVFDNAASIWSFYSYRMVKHLINELGGKSDKENLERYKKKFQKYSKRRMCECPKDAFGVQKESEKCFALKTEEDINSFTFDSAVSTY